MDEHRKVEKAKGEGKRGRLKSFDLSEVIDEVTSKEWRGLMGEVNAHLEKRWGQLGITDVVNVTGNQLAAVSVNKMDLYWDEFHFMDFSINTQKYMNRICKNKYNFKIKHVFECAIYIYAYLCTYKQTHKWERRICILS